MFLFEIVPLESKGTKRITWLYLPGSKSGGHVPYPPYDDARRRSNWTSAKKQNNKRVNRKQFLFKTATLEGKKRTEKM